MRKRYAIADIRNFASKLRWKRVWNIIKVLSSYYLSRFLQRPIQWGAAVYHFHRAYYGL
jgi:hypothetical protein